MFHSCTLIFIRLTFMIVSAGQREVLKVVHKLRKAFPLKKYNTLADSEKSETFPGEVTDKEHSGEESDDDLDDFAKLIRTIKQKLKNRIKLPNINLDKYTYDYANTPIFLCFLFF